MRASISVPEPGSSSDRVILVVNLEEKSTGDFSVSGGYSTSDGALGEVSISERNFLGRGLFAKASVQYGQYARGYSLSLVEPYLLDYRVALGLDFYQRQQLANSYISYSTKTLGFSPRLGFSLREDLTLQIRYSLYKQEITLPSVLNNCNNNLGTTGYYPTPQFIAGPCCSVGTCQLHRCQRLVVDVVGRRHLLARNTLLAMRAHADLDLVVAEFEGGLAGFRQRTGRYRNAH